MAMRGIPYMGVGRNLAYRRSMFFSNKGYGAHNHLISGDDDLFVNTHATKANTVVEISQESQTRSVPAPSVKEWITQKKRHLTTAPYYRMRDKVILTLELLTRVLFYTAFVVLICFRIDWILISAVFAARLLTQLSIFHIAQKKLNEPGLKPYLLLFDIVSPFLNGILFISNTGKKSGKNKWR